LQFNTALQFYVTTKQINSSAYYSI
jgi:hypothetical protein